MARLNVLSFQLVFCLFLLHSATATHVDEIIPLPSATVSPSNSAVAINNNQSFELNCTGTGTLSWYRGFDFDTPLINQSQLLDDNVTLSLSITLSDDESGLMDERSRTYFCIANNSLGVARSHSVLIPFFQGFGEIDNTTVIVRLGQAAALFCNVTQRPIPTIVWYVNDTIIQPNTVDDTNPKYILLDGGQNLVIYDLVNADIAATYKCGVINVVNPQTSNDSYTLFKVDTIPGGMNAFIAYRRPIANQYVSSQDSTVSYFYIAATNGNTQVEGGSGSITLTTQDQNLLRIRFMNSLVSTSDLNVILDRDSVNVDISTTVGYTIVEPLAIFDFPSVVNASSFHLFESESITFTCIANGTNPRLRWYFNGLPLDHNEETLVLNNVSVANAGIYQCFWDGFFEHERESVSWALSVQIPIPPRNIVLSGATLVDFNRTLVLTGSPATLDISFMSDSLPAIVWMYTVENVTVEINFTNNTDYRATGPVLVHEDEDIYSISLTVNNVNANTSGFYYAVIDDGRTTPTPTHQWFVSQNISLSTLKLSFGPFPCFLQSESSYVTCTAQSFPDPTITLIDSSGDPTDGSLTFDPFTGLATYTVIIGNSMTDAGRYTCRATSNGTTIRENLDTQFCSKPTIEHVSSVIGNMNGAVNINCTVNSAPERNTTVTWSFNGAEIQNSDRRIISATGNIHQIRIIALQESDAGNYTCFVNNSLIPANASATIALRVNSLPETVDNFPVLYVAVGVGGGVAILLIVIIIIIACCICCCVASRKKGNYSTNNRPHLTKDYTDGRGNVDQDSDEEDGGAEEPEAFQPQYESLPALRPAQPPQYKPSPAYNQGYGGEDIEMKKVPLPDFDDFPPHFYRQDNGGGGMMTSSVPIGSQAGLQSRFDDFMSDDGQFV